MPPLSTIAAFFLIPLQLSQWLPVEIHGLPEIREAADQWLIKSDKTAGGYVYLLPKANRPTETSMTALWKWKVSQFPNTRPSLPFDKKSDDYALRVGFLFHGPEKPLPLPTPFQKLLAEKNETVTAVLLYNAVTAPLGKGLCGPSPYHERIVYCIQGATSDYSEVSRQPFADLKIVAKESRPAGEHTELIGLWVFADSDDSSSWSEGSLRDLQIKP
jgi:hypothetical protein